MNTALEQQNKYYNSLFSPFFFFFDNTGVRAKDNSMRTIQERKRSKWVTGVPIKSNSAPHVSKI